MPSTKVFLKRRLAVLLALVLVAGAISFAAKDSIRGWYEIATGADFSGAGTGEVIITVSQGESGQQIAESLVSSGVTASFAPTYRALLATDGLFYPGDYQLRKQMNSKIAVEALQNSANRVEKRALVKEGYRSSQIFEVLSEVYGVPISDFEAVSPADLNLPSQAVNLDGYLFPATYSFSKTDTALTMLQSMWRRTQQELSSLDVPSNKIHETLTLAGLVQREGRSSEDFAKMARTFLNRVDVGMHLQSDATVSYGVNSKTVSTTAAQRANDNPWNTYKYPGLPIGPISAPGTAAIKAALNPAVGDWLFFCTVNLETGETEFNETYAGHEVSVAKWRAWMRANPGWE
ncbi:MAG: hypothetical protein RI974_183 [Actinomycetota bacterium]